jgi:hypothetical protein
MVVWVSLDLSFLGEKVVDVEVVVENFWGELSGIRLR